ncbi:hypothetical protein [Lactiplantibacillus plantarum]|uniref:hypothetical protein n=1 Tax=Lactiplantibacillus plantarum TaxID=1590 RepID=UPI000977CBB9|nr:hypothetical protein [Lactiplantibacillus plantarum]
MQTATERKLISLQKTVDHKTKEACKHPRALPWLTKAKDKLDGLRAHTVIIDQHLYNQSIEATQLDVIK